MKTYAQFFCMSTGYVEGSIPPRFGEPKLIEACGDRGVIRIDARLAPSKIAEISVDEAGRRGYLAYQVLRGESLLRARPISAIVEV